MAEVISMSQNLLTDAVNLAVSTGLIYVGPIILLVGIFFAAERIIDILYYSVEGRTRSRDEY